VIESWRFPPHFVWGAATSAYQVEGFPLADGAGASNWHRFSHTQGLVSAGDNGDLACEHYDRWQSDVGLMRELGLTAYRFSIAWSRILPTGRGQVNAKGLAFYSRLVDELLENGIEPFATLFHWDLPAALDDLGGWLNPDAPQWFGDYAELLFEALDGRVRHWTTLNEPWVVMDGGYLNGVLAPGHRSPFEAPRAAHNLLLAHAEAVRRYRQVGSHRIGLVVNLEPKHAATENDRLATGRADAYMNRYFLDPVFLGAYPKELAEIFGEAWPVMAESEVVALREPIDFLGVNYYTRSVVRAVPGKWPCDWEGVPQRGVTTTETAWEVYPTGLLDTLLWVRERYGAIPLYVTENGAAFYDPPTADQETLEDPLRVAYLRDHLGAVSEAMARGVDLRGYFAWSLLDNFEWSHGYSKRFGLIHVDYSTQKRTPKRSARFYSDVIAASRRS
jgi:beta-glucosidase